MGQGKVKRDIESEVTAKVIEALEAGVVPWRKPWSTAGVLPTSVSTGRPYRGINVMLLALSQQAHGFASNLWLTFNQAAERGGSVRKGEKGTLVVLWKNWEVRDKDSVDPNAMKRVFVLRHYTVFNLDQTDDVKLPAKLTVSPEPFHPIVEADGIVRDYVEGSGVMLRHAAIDGAFYSPETDVITVPLSEQFETAETEYSTTFHEMTHSTGHASRLDRFAKTGEPRHFGSARYAREELVAELGAAMLRGHAGIETDDADAQSYAYVASWLAALRNDKSLVITAASKAQRAVDLILDSAPEVDQNEGDAYDESTNPSNGWRVPDGIEVAV